MIKTDKRRVLFIFVGFVCVREDFPEKIFESHFYDNGFRQPGLLRISI